MIKEYEHLINKLLSKVPNYLRDDCYQAACLGLLNALERKDNIEHFNTYAYRCMKSEIIKELGRLHGNGSGIYSLDKNAFLLFCEYKKRINNNEDISDMKLSKKTSRCFEEMINSRRLSYSNPEEEGGSLYLKVFND